MKIIIKGLIVGLLLIFSGCDEDTLLPDTESDRYLESAQIKDKDKSMRTTGEVEVTYVANPGGHHDNDQGNATSEGKTRFATVVFNAHEPSGNKEAKGSLEITIKNEKDEVKRILKAKVFAAKVFADDLEARFLATVYSDERMDDGHSGNHTGSGDDHTGGTGSGAGHGTGGPDNGGHDDGTHDDGTHDDGDHGGGCNSGDEDHGNKSRVGNVIAVKVFDGGSPGLDNDTMHWRWHMGNNPNQPSVEGPQGWGDMCDKTIISGNLVVHIN